MLKKLSNLLFEDEELVEEEEIEEEEPVVVKPVQTAKPKVKETVSAPVFEEKKPAMQRIDVTQPINTQPVAKKEPEFPQMQQESVFKTPSTQYAEPKVENNYTEPVKKPSLGITVDDAPVQQKAQSAQTTRPATKKPTQTTSKPKTKKASNVYEFSPIISPFFGVDEKDLDAVQTSAKTKYEEKKNDNVSSIISPMYGMDIEKRPTTIQSSVEKSNRMEEMASNPDRTAAEADIPEFSLDDILNTRSTDEHEDIDTTTVSSKRYKGSNED